jgi:N6-adenosine-specific RNA methylase IME4
MDFNLMKEWAKFHRVYKTKFGIWLLDPAWDNTGIVKYKTQSDYQILQMPLEDTFEQGVMFLWVTKLNFEHGLKCMKKWGYQWKDTITWAKVGSDGQPEFMVGKYLSHATEFCLVGFKGRYSEFPCPVMMGSLPDLLVAQRYGKQSQKPDILYEIIEQFLPGQTVYEGYARYPHCKRDNCVSIGNEFPVDVAAPLPDIISEVSPEDLEKANSSETYIEMTFHHTKV